MKELLKKNLWFFIPYLIFLITGTFTIAFNSKGELHLFFNLFYNSTGNFLFYYLTYFGEGMIAIIAIIILLTVKYRYAISTTLSCLLSLTITQLLKQTVFCNAIRPIHFFEILGQKLQLVPGVENIRFHSFPSGHTAQAFALYLSLALLVQKKYLKFLFFFMALAVGYSRVYLSQHFFEDVYAGSLIGSTSALLIFYLFNRFGKAEWLERSLTVKNT